MMQFFIRCEYPRIAIVVQVNRRTFHLSTKWNCWVNLDLNPLIETRRQQLEHL